MSLNLRAIVAKSDAKTTSASVTRPANTTAYAALDVVSTEAELIVLLDTLTR